MSKLRPAILAVCALLLAFTTLAVKRVMKNNPEAPRKELAEAEKQLAEAGKNGNSEAEAELLKKIWDLQSVLDDAKLPEVIGKISAARASTADSVGKSLLSALELTALGQYYNDDRYRISQREDVSGMTSDDISLWSAPQFRSRIEALVDTALAPQAQLKGRSVAGYKGLFEVSEGSEIYYPTLYDAIANQSIKVLRSFLNGGGVLNPRLLEHPLDDMLYPAPERSLYGRILYIYASMAAGRDATSPATVMATVNMLGFIKNNIFTDSDVDMYGIWIDRYRAVAQSEYAPLYLINAAEYRHGEAQTKEIYNLLEEALERHPNCPAANEMKNLLATISQKHISFDAPAQVAKNAKFAVSISLDNLTTATVRLVDVTEVMKNNPGKNYKPELGRGKTVQSVTVNVEGQVPFSGKAKAEFTMPEYGLYVLETENTGDMSGYYYPIIRCSDLTSGVYRNGSDITAVTLNALTGAPVEGVSMNFTPWYNNNKVSSGQTTRLSDSNGFLPAHLSGGGKLRFTKGTDRYAPQLQVYDGGQVSRDKQTAGGVFTSLALYRPGDEVAFSFVAYEGEPGSYNPIRNRKLTLLLMRNYSEEKGRQVLQTDDWGRGEGNFTLPVAEPGNYMIRLTDDHDTFIAQTTFTVSDYKLPTFEVKTYDVVRPSSPGEPAVISGKALTFAGFPVADAQVRLQLKVRTGFWFWSRTSPTFYETTASTGADGSFRIEIPGNVMLYSPAPTGYYEADVAVTSPDGETHNTTTGYNMGKPMAISASIPSVFEVGAKETPAVKVVDYNGKEQKSVKLNYTVEKITHQLFAGSDAGIYDNLEEKDGNSSEFSKGTLESGNLSLLLGSLPSGCYRIRFATTDGSLAEPLTTNEFVVYRASDKSSPVTSMLWLPATDLYASDAGEVEITYATSLTSPRILMSIGDAEGYTVEQRWLDSREGMNRVQVKIPQGQQGMSVQFDVVQQMHRKSATVYVKAPSMRNAISIATETFRNKVIPGASEKITFRVTAQGNTPVQSAVMLDMSNKAIDVLAENPLNLSVRKRSIYAQLSSLSHFSDVSASRQEKINMLSVPPVSMPVINLTSGAVFFFAETARELGSPRRMMAKSASATMNFDLAENEAEAADYGAAAGATDEVAEADREGSGEEAQEQYRPSEIPLAFFRPMLTTDTLGQLEISYDVPDANTTWQLRALAYNSLMLTASDEVEIVASKPLMVSLNATRFLRGGDSACLSASVMNATDAPVVAHTVSEILNAATGEVMLRKEQTDTIAAMGRSVATIDVTADGLENSLIYRVKSTSGLNTDGEQTLIPVLPSEQNVIESTNFYLAPGENHFSISVPGVGMNGRAYLKFTENPAWEVVSALPALRESRIKSSMEGAAMIYTAAIADGLTRSNPDILKVLRRWSENPQDSALVSKLQNNDQLKGILLSTTPWVADALNDTERMQRLLLLLDPSNNRRLMNEGIDLLARNVTPEGGWSWTQSYPEVSEWCTEYVLSLLGGLERLGWMPSDKKLNTMVENALRYYDKTTAARFARYPKQNYLLYCYIRSHFKRVEPSTAARRVVNTAVQRIIADWRGDNVAVKAVDALVLNANGYQATARTILASLREYASQSKEKGMWWPQMQSMWFGNYTAIALTSIALDAFREVEPRCADIEKIRQWLILNKQNNDWGNSICTGQVVTSILTSGNLELREKTGTAIRIDNTLLEPQQTEYATGAFTLPVSSLLRNGGTLTIDRQGDYPSAGGVVEMRVLPMEEVRSAGSGEISVEKSLSVFNGTSWVPSDRFKVGDKVKVTLLLKVKENISYVVIQDLRAAGLEPVSQLPEPIWADGLCFYRENNDSQTDIYIRQLPAGNYVLEYDLFAITAGRFASGVAQVQSLYNPLITAHSAGMKIEISSSR